MCDGSSGCEVVLLFSFGWRCLFVGVLKKKDKWWLETRCARKLLSFYDHTLPQPAAIRADTTRDFCDLMAITTHDFILIRLATELVDSSTPDSG